MSQARDQRTATQLNDINNSTCLAMTPMYKQEADKTEVSRLTQLPRDVVPWTYEAGWYQDEQHLVEQSAVLELLLWHSQQRLTHIGITNSLLVTMNFWILQDSVAMQLTYSGNLYKEFSWKKSVSEKLMKISLHLLKLWSQLMSLFSRNSV